MKILFCDTETTGKDEQDRLIQVAYKIYSTGKSGSPGDLCLLTPGEGLFKPPVPISFEAMATHHITPEMVEKTDPFIGSAHWQTLKQAAADPETVFVAHNAPFDLAMLEKEGINFHKFIDTCRVARHVLPDQTNHQLQFLRYSLGIYNTEAQGTQATAHDAMGDVKILYFLFIRLMAVILGNQEINAQNWNEVFDKMIQLSTMPVIVQSFSFGKHAGKKLADVAKADHGYIEWLYNAELSKPTSAQNADLVYSLGLLL